MWATGDFHVRVNVGYQGKGAWAGIPLPEFYKGFSDR